MANEAGLDLVEISPNATPPVCKIMDFGKFKYEQQKRESEARKKQKIIEVKEVKFRPNTDTNDYEVKMRNVFKFLETGDKVKITLRFRGREMAHQNLGRELLERVAEDTKEAGRVENFPKMEGRQMVMLIGILIMIMLPVFQQVLFTLQLNLQKKQGQQQILMVMKSATPTRWRKWATSPQ